MSHPRAFFIAVDDEAAAEAQRRAGGPLGWPVAVGSRRWFRRKIVTLGPAFEGFTEQAHHAYDLIFVSAVLSGTSPAILEEDPRWDVSVDPARMSAFGVISIPDQCRDVLAEASDEALAGAVEPWRSYQAQEEHTLSQLGFGGSAPRRDQVSDPEKLTFLTRLRDLARSAVRQGQRLYYFDKG